MKFKINKSKCTGCGICLQTCPGATRMEEDGKSKIINQEKLEKCGGENVCPLGAIEEISEELKEKNVKPLSSTRERDIGTGTGRGVARGTGRGMGRGMGRGLGGGPRDGRGGGRGGGGRRN